MTSTNTNQDLETTVKSVFITNIEDDTLDNTYFRKVIYTSKHQQLVLMSIKPRSDIPYEIHSEHDQFIRIEKGTGVLVVGENKDEKYDLSDGIAFIVPAGTWHQIINTSDEEDLKLYTIYSPPEHAADKIDIDRPDSANTNKINTIDEPIVAPTIPSQTGGSTNYKSKYYKYKTKYMIYKKAISN